MAPDWPTETISDLPSLRRIYARAAAASSLATASRALPSKAHEAVELHLPNTVLQVPRVDTAHLGTNLRDYQRLVHEVPANTLPGGFMHILVTPVAKALIARSGVSLPVNGLFHVFNDASVLRPIQLGEVLDVKAWADNLRPHLLGLALDLHTTASAVENISGRKGIERDAAGRAVSGGLTPGFGQAQPPVSGAKGSGRSAAHGRHAKAGAEPEDLVFQSTSTYVLRVPGHPELGEVAAGDVGRPANPRGWQPPQSTTRWALPHGLSRAYSGISGERNPLNLSNLAARSYGLPRAALQTAYLGARVLAELGNDRGDAYRWTIDMARPVTTPTTMDVAIKPSGDRHEFVGWLGATDQLVFQGHLEPLATP